MDAGSHASPKREREESASRTPRIPAGCAGGSGRDGDARWWVGRVSILPQAGECSEGMESHGPS